MRKSFLLLVIESLRGIAISLLSFFSGIYIFLKTGNLLIVFLCFLVLYLVKFLSTTLAETLSLRFGLKAQIALGNLLLAGSLVSFAISTQYSQLFWLGFVLFGLGSGLFWFGRHGLLIKLTQQEQRKLLFGKISGTASFLASLSEIITPLLGGILIYLFDYRGLFLGSLLFVFLAIGALKFLPDEKTHIDVTLLEIFKLFSAHKKWFISYFCEGIRAALYAGAFIIYLFLILKKELALGGFLASAIFLVALTKLTIGWWIDKRDYKELFVVGNFLYVFVWLYRYLSQSVPAFLILEIGDRIASGMVGIPLEAISFKKAITGHSTARAVLFRELAGCSGQIFAASILILGTLLRMPLQYSFLIGAAFSVLPILIIVKK